MKRLMILAMLVLLPLGLYAYDPVLVIQGSPGATIAETTSDSAQSLATGLSTNILVSGSKTIVAVLITCEANNIRFAFGGTTPTASLGHILYKGQSIRLTNAAAIRTFKYINDDAGSNALLHITPEY